MLVKHIKNVGGTEDVEIPKGWHLMGNVGGADYTLCGIDIESSTISKTVGKVTCKSCKSIIKYCRNKEIKLG